VFQPDAFDTRKVKHVYKKQKRLQLKNDKRLNVRRGYFETIDCIGCLLMVYISIRHVYHE